MSDCSTAAMLPKEPPKKRELSLVEELHLIQEACIYNIEMSEGSSFHCYDITGDFFDKHIVAKAEELEQRHERLKQVAWDMWITLISTDDLFIQERASRHRDCLEALGVQVGGIR